MLESFRIRVFRSVARHLNFSRAAEELLMTQPAVTQQIKALEDELGVPLFDRAKGHILLTPSGHALLPYADKLKALSDEGQAAAAAAHGQQSGCLALGASQTIGQYLLPNLIAAFRKLHPKVQITARSGNTNEVLEALASGRIQLALIEGPDRRNDLHIEPFMEDHMVLVVPADHAWAGHDIDPASLKGEPILMREFGSGSRRVVEQALAAVGLKPKDIRVGMEFDSTEGQLSAVEAGIGITFVSRWAVRNQLALGTLKLAHVEGLKLSRWFSLARLAGPQPTGNVGAFRTLLLSNPLDLALRTTGKPAKRKSAR